MGAIVNGLALHGFRAYGATFLTFSDYMRGALRLSALMKLPSIWVYTHDSIGLGEDGPTHQPIEQLAGLRAMPRLNVIRPADANETALAWRFALRQNEAPTAFALSRQNLPILDPASDSRRRDRAGGVHPQADRRGGRAAGPDPDRDRVGGLALPGGGGPAHASTPCASSRCPAWTRSPRPTRPTSIMCCRRL